jgi:hypothetical protein
LHFQLVITGGELPAVLTELATYQAAPLHDFQQATAATLPQAGNTY